jgi:hypothetical protein
MGRSLTGSHFISVFVILLATIVLAGVVWAVAVSVNSHTTSVGGPPWGPESPSLLSRT